jgi:hypothetical protein
MKAQPDCARPLLLWMNHHVRALSSRSGLRPLVDSYAPIAEEQVRCHCRLNHLVPESLMDPNPFAKLSEFPAPTPTLPLGENVLVCAARCAVVKARAKKSRDAGLVIFISNHLHLVLYSLAALCCRPGLFPTSDVPNGAVCATAPIARRESLLPRTFA